MELGRSGRAMMMTSASPSGGDGGVAGSLSEVQRPTGSSTAIAKFCSNDGRGGELVIFAAPTRARGGPTRIGRGGAEQTDRLEPPGRRCGCWLTSPFLFSGIVVRRFRFGATGAFGRQDRHDSAGMRLVRAPANSTGSSTTRGTLPAGLRRRFGIVVPPVGCDEASAGYSIGPLACQPPQWRHHDRGVE